MAKNSIRDYSATNSSNTDIQSIDISEGCSPAGINNAIREVMADLKDVSTGAVALESPAADSLSVTGDLTVDTNTLYVDSTNNRVGIGTSSPVSKLDLASGNITISNSTNTPYINFVDNTTRSQSISRITMDQVSGTAGQLLFSTTTGGTLSERMRINDYGSVGIGRSDPQNIVGPHGGGLVVQSAADRAGTTTAVAFQNSSGNNQFQQLHNGETTFSTGSTLRMRIATDGSLLLGKASGSDTVVGCHIEPAYGGYKAIAGSSWPWGVMVNRQDNDGSAITLRRANTDVGSITVTGSSTSYNTSSDYRLKTAVTYDWDATTRLKQLRPARFEWIADGDDAVPVDGFLAHEVEGIVPESVTGTKDGMRDEEYQVSAATGDIYTPATDDVAEVIHSTDVERPEELAEGQLWRETTPEVMGTRSVPDYQGIDQSKLTPLLTKALIEAVEKIEQLEARITALEAN